MLTTTHDSTSRKLWKKKKTAFVFPLQLFWPPCSATAKQLQIYFSWLTKWHFKYTWACSIPSERFWKYPFNGISHAPRHWNLQLQNEFFFVVVKWLQIRVVKRTTMGKQMRFFFAYFSTSCHHHNHVVYNTRAIVRYLWKGCNPRCHNHGRSVNPWGCNRGMSLTHVALIVDWAYLRRA